MLYTHKPVSNYYHWWCDNDDISNYKNAKFFCTSQKIRSLLLWLLDFNIERLSIYQMTSWVEISFLVVFFCPASVISPLYFHYIWCFRPYKPYIFWRLMTPTIHWLTDFSPITHCDNWSSNGHLLVLRRVLRLARMLCGTYKCTAKTMIWQICSIRPDKYCPTVPV